MATAVISSKGQITLPKEVRRKLGVETGDRVEFVETEEGMFALIAATRDIRELKGAIGKPARAVNVEDMNRAITRRGAGR